MYLGKYSKESNLLSFRKKSNDIEDFIDKTSFMPLDPICRKDDYTSFGYVNREKINDKLIDILYYINTGSNFPEKKKIYKTLTNKYKKSWHVRF